MMSIDTWLEQWLHGGATLGVVLLVSLVLGLRHASDPDHLAAVTSLIAGGDTTPRAHKAGLMGLSWGLGHATTLVLLGLPVLLFNRYLPALAQRLIEVAIGCLIIVLATRLLVRWRRNRVQPDPSMVVAEQHNHARHDPRHTQGSGNRTPLGAFVVGLLHGAGGTAGLTLLLLARIPNRAEATTALVLFAFGTALSMALVSSGFGWIITSGPVARHFDRMAPVLGAASLVFGASYLWNAFA
jgi:ABC-type nickel/cobalt efflux system permease component RcnA